MSKQYFGTDGIRGEVGKGAITPEFVLKLGWAVGRVLSSQGTHKVLIGKDTRISGYMLESALESGLSAAGVNIGLLGPMPTPAIAYLSRTFRADAGIVISASHNPYQDNGIKFFSRNGTKLGDDIELAIEAELNKPMSIVESSKLGKARRIDDAAGRYIEFCKSRYPSDMSLKGLKIVVDCANGATYHIAPNVLRELGAEVIEIGTSPDGVNINLNCGATSLKALQEKVLEIQADVGFALDGDGDRLMMVDHKGNVIDGDQLVFIIARDALRRGEMHGGVVGTVMSNLGMEIGVKRLGIPFARSKVGDRYVLELLQQNGWYIGGESSGHIINLHSTSTGDGIISGLQVLRAMQTAEMSLYELSLGMDKYPQTLINVRFADGQEPLEADTVKQAVADVEASLGDTGRVLMRKSGTEPVIRVMVEGENADEVEQHAKSIASAVEQAVK
ncbi:phosphoglucosamine mutase [Catenovulum agarivorans DS-2]|uniref:Phosphoglucosamine mutase n=1 Tax=Catenovulum agarivorans DS-2 TaxID=1328313 RepID=W7QSZ3_9ALTE|nr:phosphoglucosamine mutase [Catenovulum agarivorans]EWH08535.1 phosphoglucosamine mutase [Catenovulum agarivorans DS-2]